MDSRQLWPLVLVAIGVVLVLNPVYLYPNGVPHEQTYRLQGERPDDLGAILSAGDRGGSILDCPSESAPFESRSCVFESLVTPNQSLLLPNRTLADSHSDDDRLQYPFDFVRLQSGFYEPQAREENGSVALSLEPVTVEAVAERLHHTSYREAPESVQRAIDTGNATTTVRFPPGESYGNDRTDRLDEYVGTVGKVVVKNGTYYHVSSGVSHDRAFPPILLELLRILGVLAGAFFVTLAVRRQRDLTNVDT